MTTTDPPSNDARLVAASAVIFASVFAVFFVVLSLDVVREHEAVLRWATSVGLVLTLAGVNAHIWSAERVGDTWRSLGTLIPPVVTAAGSSVTIAGLLGTETQFGDLVIVFLACAASYLVMLVVALGVASSAAGLGSGLVSAVVVLSGLGAGTLLRSGREDFEAVKGLIVGWAPASPHLMAVGVVLVAVASLGSRSRREEPLMRALLTFGAGLFLVAGCLGEAGRSASVAPTVVLVGVLAVLVGWGRSRADAGAKRDDDPVEVILIASAGFLVLGLIPLWQTGDDLVLSAAFCVVVAVQASLVGSASPEWTVVGAQSGMFTVPAALYCLFQSNPVISLGQAGLVIVAVALLWCSMHRLVTRRVAVPVTPS